MKPSSLLTSQTNQLVRLISVHEMDRGEFEWAMGQGSSVGHRNIDVLTHRPTGYYFEFDYHDGDVFGANRGRKASYSPGRETHSAYRSCETWEDIAIAFEDWLTYIKREQEPDLWFSDSIPAYRSWQENDNKLSQEELRRVLVGLDAIEALLIKHSNGQKKVLDDIQTNIQYLKESAQKMGKKDFINILVGILAQHVFDWCTGIHWQAVFHSFLQSVTIISPTLQP